MKDLNKKQSVLTQLKERKKLEPYLQHIRFPAFKNLEANLKIDFDFPLTALVGQNGTSKSSILRAIYSCPRGQSLEKFWFSTDLDDIKERSGRSRFIYQYFQPDAKRDVEVIKTRIQRTFKGSAELNPEYWEPSRPLKGDGMEGMPRSRNLVGRNKTRWNLMEKNTIFIDFRSEISAFDKYFYHGDLNRTLKNASKQNVIRSKSVLIKKAVSEGWKSKKMYKNKKEHIFRNENLPEDQVKVISEILGREYSDIQLLEHRFFSKSPGVTVLINSNGLQYSEAFAGSGEFAVVMLVNKIMDAEERSLIILDEPEVSLHPGAQERLIYFLMDQIKIKKHQVVLGTHSPFILKLLPENAIKTLYRDPGSNEIKSTSSTLHEESFFHLEIGDLSRVTIYVEDRLAKELVIRALRLMGQAIHTRFEVEYIPGGASSLLLQVLPTYAFTNQTMALFLMDGDQKPKESIDLEVGIDKLTDDQLTNTVKAVLWGEPFVPQDGGNDQDSKKRQLREAHSSILRYCSKYLKYLPGVTPESFIWENMDQTILEGKEFSSDCAKERFEELTMHKLGKESYENVSSDEIFELQKRCITTLSPSLFDVVQNSISSFLSSFNNGEA